MKTVTTNRICNGQFEVLADGEKTQFEIINGSLGVSGNGSNIYGIVNNETGKYLWFGSLQKCKKTVTYWINKK